MSADKILFLLKSRGAQTSQLLSAGMAITSEGVRQHLTRLANEGLVEHADRRESVGRPKRYWQLTPAGHARFPDTHAFLTVELLSALRAEFGEEGVMRLLGRREKETLKSYREKIKREQTLAKRVKKLADIRTSEGYMASVEKLADGEYLLIEDHCPICAAAKSCQGLCKFELDTFQKALGRGVSVKREEHLLSGGRRCTYRISER